MYSCILCKKESDKKLCSVCKNNIINDLKCFKANLNISFTPIYSDLYYVIIYYKNSLNKELASIFANKIKQSININSYYITYVPCSKKRKKDHMKEIAKLICDDNIILIDLFNRKNNEQTKNLNKKEREKSKFNINRLNLDNKPIVIIDDIITTFSSLKECMSLVNKNYNNKVLCVSLAF